VSSPVFPVSHGKIAFHRYTSDSAYDGELFIADLDAGSLHNVSQYWDIDHAQSAHFSPDGTQLVFMGVPEGQHSYSSREIYLWNLTTGSPPPDWAHPVRLTENSVPDEDPKFSFSGRYICYKSNKDLRVYDLVTHSTTSLTNDGWAIEQWNPYFSRDDQYLFYTEGLDLGANILKMKISDLSVVTAEGIASLQEYYSIVRNDGSYFYTRWYSIVDHHDQVYLRTATTNQPVAFNSSLHDYADAFPVDDSHALFASTRTPGNSWDIFLGNIKTGEIYQIPIDGINSSQMELGCTYSANADLVPTLIDNFTARRERGGVVVLWRVFTRDSGFFFNIYKQVEDQVAVRVNEDTIFGKGELEFFDSCNDPGEIRYTLECINENNVVIWSSTVVVNGTSGNVPQLASIAAYPNPFNPQVTIEYTVPVAGQTTIAVYDMRGRVVRILKQGLELVGVKALVWDGTKDDYAPAATGVYLVRIHGDNYVASQKITLVE
jgi:Tol biopolymer transport system component